MTKETQDTTNTTQDSKESRGRDKRRKVYERTREAHIPEDVQAAFMKDEYELRLVRWGIRGEEDYRNLHRRTQEGYEFVKADELKKVAPDFFKTLRLRDTSTAKGLVTLGDSCIMKIDTDLRQSRREFFKGVAADELNAVDVHVLEKKGRLVNTGSKSQVINKEPSFRS